MVGKNFSSEGNSAGLVKRELSNLPEVSNLEGSSKRAECKGRLGFEPAQNKA